LTTKRSTAEILDILKERRDDSASIYDYSKFVYHGNEKRSIFVCKNHGEFSQLFKVHISNGECPFCRAEKKRKSALDNFLKASLEKRTDAGLVYDYSKVDYINNYTPVEIVCNVHGSFWQTPNNHSTKDSNCPSCAIEIAKQTSIKNWGTVHPMKSKKVQDKLKKVFTEKYGVDNPSKNPKVQIKISKALRQISSSEKEEFKRYYYRVMYRTKQSSTKVLNIDKRNYKTYHLDHKYSIVKGFKEKIPSEIIGSVVNLEIISAANNLKKGASCSITKKELLEMYEKLDK
jgi:hypothetical protein